MVSLELYNVCISILLIGWQAYRGDQIYNIINFRESLYEERYKKWRVCHFFVLPAIDSLY